MNRNSLIEAVNGLSIAALVIGGLGFLVAVIVDPFADILLGECESGRCDNSIFFPWYYYCVVILLIIVGLKDYRGHQGRIGDDYLAWQIPNSYSGCHQQLPKGRQKRINRELADLFVKEMTGNGKTAFEKRYYANGKLAAKAYNRCPQRELY